MNICNCLREGAQKSSNPDRSLVLEALFFARSHPCLHDPGNKVLCAGYRLPDSLPHLSKIMEGTDVGEPVLTDADMPHEEALWHEKVGGWVLCTALYCYVLLITSHAINGCRQHFLLPRVRLSIEFCLRYGSLPLCVSNSSSLCLFYESGSMALGFLGSRSSRMQTCL